MPPCAWARVVAQLVPNKSPPTTVQARNSRYSHLRLLPDAISAKSFRNLVLCERQIPSSKSRKINRQRPGKGQGFLKAYRRPVFPFLQSPLFRSSKSLTCNRRSSQLRIFRLGLLQDGDVGVGVFPEHEETLRGYGGMMTPICAGSAVLRSRSPCRYGRLMGYVETNRRRENNSRPSHPAYQRGPEQGVGLG